MITLIDSPLEKAPTTGYEFYQKISKILRLDVAKMANNGMSIDMDLLDELEFEIDTMLKNNTHTFVNNSVVKNYHFEKEGLSLPKKRKDFLAQYNHNNPIHVSNLINCFLDDIGQKKYKTEVWTKSTIEFLLSSTDVPKKFPLEVINNSFNEYKDVVEEYMVRLSWEQYNLYKKQKTQTSFEVNLNSSKQKKDLLEFAGINVESTERKLLEKARDLLGVMEESLMESTKESIEILDVFIAYSHASYIKNNIIKNIRKNLVGDKIYPKFKAFGTKTFRVSCTEPNVLQIPKMGNIFSKKLKKCFKARDGFLLYQIDYKAIEDVVLTNLSECGASIEIYENGLDSHSYKAITYFKDEAHALLPMNENESMANYVKRFYLESKSNPTVFILRELSKPITFALGYLGGIDAIKRITGKSTECCQKIINQYNSQFHELDSFKNRVLKEATKNNGISLGLGLDLFSYKPKDNFTTLYNAKMQFWSIISLVLMHNIHDYVSKHNSGLHKNNIRIISSVYDSLVVEVKDDPKAIQTLQDAVRTHALMPFMNNQRVPLDCSISIGKTLDDLSLISIDTVFSDDPF